MLWGREDIGIFVLRVVKGGGTKERVMSSFVCADHAEVAHALFVQELRRGVSRTRRQRRTTVSCTQLALSRRTQQGQDREFEL